MKFGAEYQEALKKEEYPTQWLASAISYKKLKKCIKRVREELASLGLDRETLEALWQHVGTTAFSDSANLDAERMLRYQFTTGESTPFVPKLTIALDPRDGSPMDAWLSPETRRILQKVGTRKERRPGAPSRQASEVATNCDHKPDLPVTNGDPSRSHSSSPTRDADILSNGSLHTPAESITRSDTPEISEPALDESLEEPEPAIETIEIPLTSDSEFFQILRKELQALESLQDQEQRDIITDITQLSTDLRALRDSNKKSSRTELDTWREIFRLYIESEIFMSNHESDAGVRPADKAATYFNQYLKQLKSVNTNPPKPKSAEAHIALDRFLNINTTLLRLIKFQELNKRALGKILKKFDKQTSLHAISTTTPDHMLKTLTTHPNRPGLSPHDLARSTAYAISESLLSLIPQLDDYLCPICCMITYKPVRLRCNHVFCIRCMIRLQRQNKDECPLCRMGVVLEATEENLDAELKKFLKREFRADVEEKKRDNELQAGRELFGESYSGSNHRCMVM